MKIAFLLGSPDISGGTYVIFEHALKNKDRGDEITIITEEKVSSDRLYWHPMARELIWKTYDEVQNEIFDLVITTWWRTFYEMYRVNGKKYCYFVQSIESRFYGEEEKPLKMLCEASYLLNIPIITEATWIKNYLHDKYDCDPILVRNGIRKDIYTNTGERYEKKTGLRVLIEGPIDVDFKNVPDTISIVQKSKADEIWLLTSSSVSQVAGVDRVFSKVPIAECAKIYRSCDVIVKLSYVEGMFGPPLEMFHCGGTAITYDVTGHDEYIVNGVNGLVAKKDDRQQVIRYINMLKENPDRLALLKENALKTAAAWDSWEQASLKFREALTTVMNCPSCLQQELMLKSKFLFDFYVVAEDNRLNVIKNSRVRKFFKYIEFNFPRVTKILVKIKKFLHINIRFS